LTKAAICDSRTVKFSAILDFHVLHGVAVSENPILGLYLLNDINKLLGDETAQAHSVGLLSSTKYTTEWAWIAPSGELTGRKLDGQVLFFV
jgi:hypothetical protein